MHQLQACVHGLRLTNHERLCTGDECRASLKLGAWVALQDGHGGKGGRVRGDGGRGNGRMSTGLRPVDEGTRIDLANLLEEFQHSEDTGDHHYVVIVTVRSGLA